MTADHDLERRLADYYAGEGAVRAPDRVLGNALATLETTTQRRVPVHVPWRFPTMNNTMRLAAAAVAVIALAGIGFVLTRQPAGGVGGPAPTASPAPSRAPSATPSPAASAAPGPTSPPLSETFTSNRYGISIGYPAGWTTQAATQQAVDPDVSFPGPMTDLIYEPLLRERLFLTLSSLPLGSASAADWIASAASALECSSTQPVTVGGASGALCADGQTALVPTGDRGYVIRLYTGDGLGTLESVYTPAWFRDVLDTVKLSPADTVIGSPSPS